MSEQIFTTPPPTPSRTPSPFEAFSDSSPDSLLFGPPNPYLKNSRDGHIFRAMREHLGHPKPIDEWLQANTILCQPPSDPRAITTSIYNEEVNCTVEMKHIRAKISRHFDPNDPFTDIIVDERFVLFLTVTIPDSSEPSTLVWHRTSPPAVLGRWFGEKTQITAPDWCRSMDVGEKVEFTQPRCGIAEFFAQLALTAANREEGTSAQMLRWAEEASIINQVLRQYRYNWNLTSTPSCRSGPSNYKRHRLNASEMVENEAAELRRMLNSSPCTHLSKRRWSHDAGSDGVLGV